MYHFEEVTLKNVGIEKKVLVIKFENKAMDIIAEFLMTDASLLNYEVLDMIELVLSSASEHMVFSGNRCYLEINKDKTHIADLLEDMFDDFDTLPAYNIDTKELKELILAWRDEAKKY